MIPLRLARELTYQLEKAGEHERLARVLAKIPVFLIMYKAEDVFTVLAFWEMLAKKSHKPETYYHPSLDEFRKNHPNLLPEALYTLNRLFESRGSYELSNELLSELLRWSEEHEDKRRAMDACN